MVDAHGKGEVLAGTRIDIGVQHDVALALRGAAVVEDVGIAGVAGNLAVAPLRVPCGGIGRPGVEATSTTLADAHEEVAVVHLLQL